MIVEVRILNQSPMMDVIEAERLTTGSPLVKMPADMSRWWEGRVRALHSSLRCVRFRVVWRDVGSDAAHQLVRATMGMTQTLMKSSRPDVTGKPRPTGVYLTDVMVDTDAEGWLHLAAQRLCGRAEAPVRDAVQRALEAMLASDYSFLQALAKASAPRCEASGRCPELVGCGRRPHP